MDLVVVYMYRVNSPECFGIGIVWAGNNNCQTDIFIAYHQNQ